MSFSPAAGTSEHLSLSVAFEAVDPVEACAYALQRCFYVSLAGNTNITLAYDAHRSLIPGPNGADESLNDLTNLGF